jgi:hypothetical protein
VGFSHYQYKVYGDSVFLQALRNVRPERGYRLVTNIDLRYSTDMVWLARKRLFCLTVMAYTALAVLVSSAVAEPFLAVQFEIRNNSPDTISASLEDFFIQNPAEQPAIATKLGSSGFFPLHVGFQRIAFLSGLPISGTSHSKASMAAGTQTRYGDLKNNILLKLRI